MKLFGYLTIAAILSIYCSVIEGWPVSRAEIVSKLSSGVILGNKLCFSLIRGSLL